MNIKFVKFDEQYLEKSYEWLTDLEIKEMVCAPTIIKKEQKKWYDSLQFRKDYYLWGIKKDEEPIGVVGLKNINYLNGTGEFFGYIGEKQFWGMGIGTEMLIFIKKKAEELGLKLLQLKVCASNTRAIRLYKKFGFISLGEANVSQNLLTLNYNLVKRLD